MDISDLTDYNARHYLELAKNGHAQAIHKLFYSLKNSVDDEAIGTLTKEVVIEILTTVAALPECAQKALRISHGDSSQLIVLLKNEVRTDSLTPISRFMLKEVFHNLQMNRQLAKKALGVKPGRPPDPLKLAANVRLATLVLYYYEKTGILFSNRSCSGAFVLAAEHAYSTEEPSDAQVRAARYAWEFHEKAARDSWNTVCKSYAQWGSTPIPKDDYMLSSELDGYVT